MRMLVTGGAGLIGSRLCHLLAQAGHEVLVLDNFTFSYEMLPSQHAIDDTAYRLNHYLERTRIVRCSILEKLRMADAFARFRPECVIHLAATPLVALATEHQEEASLILSTGLTNVLEVVRATDSVQRFVFVSSSMVYGDFAFDPMPEDGPLDPVNLYGGLKLAGEVLTRAYLKRTGISPVIIRPSCVYGPTERHNRVVKKFCEAALVGEPLVLRPDNDHALDFTYIDDAAQGLILAATVAEAAGETFNLSYGDGRPLSDLAEILSRHVANLRTSSQSLGHVDRPKRGGLCIAKARRLLGYAPAWPLERGVEQYLTWLRNGPAQTLAA